MNKAQLEISFEGQAACLPVSQRQRRIARASWWFGQMRRVVSCARDWNAEPPARPEQTYLTLSRGR